MPSRSTLLSGQKRQWAVYWGGPVATGDDGREFDDPAEIKVRWEDVGELFVDQDGNELMSRAIVETLEDVIVGGYLWLGRLTELESGAQTPFELRTAYEIRRVEKVPFLNHPTRYTRHAYLSENRR